MNGYKTAQGQKLYLEKRQTCLIASCIQTAREVLIKRRYFRSLGTRKWRTSSQAPEWSVFYVHATFVLHSHIIPFGQLDVSRILNERII